ncbi:hypothetical protein [Burkholderia sp. BCC0097]|uniref:hypothetical protein n=1 Tax=Burkholderia sp. BCC0097 TaxID=2676289 RepID=UPI00158BEA46|nr:hypothetical protein [Burkholderia sp. BCC0097]
MALQTKEQLAKQRELLALQLQKIEEEEKNFEKKQEGFTKLEELQAKFDTDCQKIAKQFHIAEEELKAFFGPKPLIAFYFEKAGVQKVYEWYKGKIGKAPMEFEMVKSQGEEAVKQHLTEAGKIWIATDDGAKEFKAFVKGKEKK